MRANAPRRRNRLWRASSIIESMKSETWGLPMTWITRHVLAISVAILASFFAVSNSVAQQCRFNGDCKLPLTCQPGFLGGICGTQACNVDTDCRNGSVCDLGICFALCTRTSDCNPGEVCVRGGGGRICVQRPASSGSGGSGGTGSGVTRYYTEGGVCGTIRRGPVDHPIVKHIGCAPGLRCSNPNGSGVCQRPPA